jgi:hypothetical protein
VPARGPTGRAVLDEAAEQQQQPDQGRPQTQPGQLHRPEVTDDSRVDKQIKRFGGQDAEGRDGQRQQAPGRQLSAHAQDSSGAEPHPSCTTVAMATRMRYSDPPSPLVAAGVHVIVVQIVVAGHARGPVRILVTGIASPGPYGLDLRIGVRGNRQ